MAADFLTWGILGDGCKVAAVRRLALGQNQQLGAGKRVVVGEGRERREVDTHVWGMVEDVGHTDKHGSDRYSELGMSCHLMTEAVGDEMRCYEHDHSLETEIADTWVA